MNRFSGLRIAVHDAFFVRRSETIGELNRIVQGFPNGQRSVVDGLAQGLSFEQLRYQVRGATVSADVVNGQNVGVIQGGGSQGLLFKATQAIGVAGVCGWENLERDAAA